MPCPDRLFGLILLVMATLGLAACESREERAQTHYQRGIDLAEGGDPDRAMIEFRNVLRLDADHAEARLAFARLLRDRGDMGGAVGQYALLADQDRNSLEAHRELAELALRTEEFETAAEAARRALEIAPKDPAARAVKAMLNYREGKRAAALAMARDVIAETPGAVIAQMVLIADHMNDGDDAGALAQADAALAAAPRDEGLHLVRLAALEQMGDTTDVGAQLDRMAKLFPDNPGVAEAMVRWRMRQGDMAGAETALRALAARGADAPGPALIVVQFLYETQGAAAAKAELDRLIGGAAAPLPYQRARASLDFSEGRHAEAIAALTALTEGAALSDEIRDAQAELAAMQDSVGNMAARDALIAAVLAGDPKQLGALKLRARARIAADRPELAVQDMRLALASAPRDPEIMTILAEAHIREGARELAGERLALAVEVSDRAPVESLRYARFLIEEGRTGPAEGVVADALRREPENRDLLAVLGRIHLERRDWERAAEVAARLRASSDPAAAEAAASLEMASLTAQDRREEMLAMLRDLAGPGENAAAIALMQNYVAAGELDAAQEYLDGILAADPTNALGITMQAGLMAARSESQAAEALYRGLIDEVPASPQPYQGLFALLVDQGRNAEAETVLAAGLKATKGDGDLMFLQAGLLEQKQDFEGAIAVYEALYGRDSANLLLANNLASLLASHRDDAASLERAFAIARRLRGSDVPYFQDTYGWILHRRGDSAQAVEALEPAARALEDNALAYYHLGEAQLALGRDDAARASFGRAIGLAEGGPDASLPQITAARARVIQLDSGDSMDAAASGG